MRAMGAWIVASAVSFAPLPVRADVSPVRTSVEVDTSEVGESGPVIARRIRERSDVVLRQEGVLPSRGEEDPVVLVTVMELVGEDPGYAFDLRAQRDGQDLLHTERFQCRLCTETELVSEVESRLAAIVGQLGAKQAEAAEPPATESEPPRPAAVEPEPARDAHEGLGPLGKAGIGVLVTGTVGLGVGIGLAARKDTPQRIATKQTSTKPPGYALIGVGAALAITGGVLLVLDRKRARRRTAFAPWLDPTGAGLAVAGRF